MNTRYSPLKKLRSLIVATISDSRFKSDNINSNEVDIAGIEQMSFLTESEVSMQSSRRTDNDDANGTPVQLHAQAYYIKQEKRVFGMCFKL
ncbi:hypothetical protein HHI36_019663, partial [Cryptolaemus montrouzieri]